MVTHHIHMKSINFCIVSDALLIGMSPLKSCCMFIHGQPSTKKPCSSQHFLNMFEKWVDLKVRVCYSWWWFDQRILCCKKTLTLLVAEVFGWPKHMVDKRANLDWVLVGISELHLYSWRRI